MNVELLQLLLEIEHLSESLYIMYDWSNYPLGQSPCDIVGLDLYDEAKTIRTEFETLLANKTMALETIQTELNSAINSGKLGPQGRKSANEVLVLLENEIFPEISSFYYGESWAFDDPKDLLADLQVKRQRGIALQEKVAHAQELLHTVRSYYTSGSMANNLGEVRRIFGK